MKNTINSWCTYVFFKKSILKTSVFLWHLSDKLRFFRNIGFISSKSRLYKIWFANKSEKCKIFRLFVHVHKHYFTNSHLINRWQTWYVVHWLTTDFSNCRNLSNLCWQKNNWCMFSFITGWWKNHKSSNMGHGWTRKIPCHYICVRDPFLCLYSSVWIKNIYVFLLCFGSNLLLDAPVLIRHILVLI